MNHATSNAAALAPAAPTAPTAHYEPRKPSTPSIAFAPFGARLPLARTVWLLSGGALLAALCASGQAQSLRTTPRLSGPAPSSAPSTSGAGGDQLAADFIVAVVDSEPITNNEVKIRLLRAEQQMAKDGGALPPRDQLAKQVLDRLINERAQIQLGRDTGMKVEEPAIDAAVATLARQNQLSPDAFRKRVESEGLSWSVFRGDMRDEILLGRLRERDVESRVRVSDGDVDEYIRANADLSDPDRIALNLAQILIPLPDAPTAAQVAAARAAAEKAYERAAAPGANFAALAKELSKAPESDAGGELGVREASRYPELFLSATQALKVGAVARPVQSGAGFHVLKVIEKRSAGMPNTMVSQTRARHILLRTGPQVSESAAIDRLTAMRRQVLAGSAEFAALAKANSQDGSAAQGGDLGWTSPGSFVPEFEDLMNTLAPGQMGEPVVSRFGVHLIQVTERRQQELGDKEQRELVRNAVRNKKTDEQYLSWTQEVRGKAYVEYRDAVQVR